MIYTTRHAVTSVFLIFIAAVCSSSQTTPEKSATASISGKVKFKDKGVAGIVVFAQDQNSPRRIRPYRGTTDSTGSYRISNVPAGTYIIAPVAPAFALNEEINSVVITEGETIEDINFSLVPGGVITGKITDADGKPLIEESVTVLPIETTYMTVRYEGYLRTDDRGIYRAFGLRPGKYKVFVGHNDSLPGGTRPAYRQTFYPSVTDIAKATVIEVTEGSETTNVDIVTGRPVTTFKVSGRILDGETGKPLSQIKYGVYRSREEHGGSSTIGETITNSNGEFKLENVQPGKYAVFVVPEDSGVRGDSVSFEVVDHDVVDLVIKAGKAATVSGVVVFEGTEESKSRFKTNDLYINAFVEGAEERFTGGYSQPIKPDGSFRIGDLRKGTTHFSFASLRRNEARHLQLVRIERDGVIQPRGLVLKDGEQVTGVRLVVKYLTGAIHGQIKVEGDDELPSSRIAIWITYLDDARQGESFSMGNSSPQLDSRKRFVVDGLAAGTYEVNVGVFEPNRQDSNRVLRQQVTVADNAVSEVTITIKTKP